MLYTQFKLTNSPVNRFGNTVRLVKYAVYPHWTSRILMNSPVNRFGNTVRPVKYAVYPVQTDELSC